MASDGINRGLAAKPAWERSLRIDEPIPNGELSCNQRRHREAMAGNTPPQRFGPDADFQPSVLDADDWDHEHDEVAGRRA
jgi:hypothetical protein